MKNSRQFLHWTELVLSFCALLLIIVNVVLMSMSSFKVIELTKMVPLRDEYLTQQRLIINKINSIEEKLQYRPMEEIVLTIPQRKPLPAFTPELNEKEVPDETEFDRR